MSCNFNNISPGCESSSNVDTLLGSNLAIFVANHANGYQKFGCNWFVSRKAFLQNQVASYNYGPTQLAIKLAKIAYLDCMYNQCCETPIILGCMDDGNMPNTYQNNQGGFGSVIPGTPATNYYSAATQDNGTCVYPDPAIGCNDPYAPNYNDPANYPSTTTFLDCATPPNVMGSASYLAAGPYGDTSCCNYDPHPCNLQIGDTGPSGGIVFAVPGAAGQGGQLNTTSFYFEIWPYDIGQSTMPGTPQITTPCSSAGTGGHEWGLHNTPIPSGSLNNNYGGGLANTLYISSAANGTTVGSGNSLAVDTAMSVAPSVGDWYLPNWAEWNLIAHAVNNNTIPGLQSLTGKYWSSSPSSSGHEYALAAEVTGFGATMFPRPRCHTYKVRPIRKFACAEGIKYNFRWRESSNSHFYTHPGVIQGVGAPCNLHAWTPPGGTSNCNYGMGVWDQIGLPWFHTLTNNASTTLINSSYLPNKWPSPLTGSPFDVLISAWDKHEVFLGSWKYGSNTSGVCSIISGCYRRSDWYLVAHVSGSSSIIKIPDHSYIKIEHISLPNTNDPTYFSDTSDLSNYAGTGTNIRMIDPVSGAPLPGTPQYWNSCVSRCGGVFGNGCKVWHVSVPPNITGPLSGPLSTSGNCCAVAKLADPENIPTEEELLNICKDDIDE